jgi:hypothetical protein
MLTGMDNLSSKGFLPFERPRHLGVSASETRGEHDMTNRELAL